jgi:hypothetical protein
MENKEFQNAWTTPRQEVAQQGFSTTLYKDWDEYGVQQHDVHLNGLPTGKRHIVYKNQFVNTCSKQYVLLPNEQVINTVEKIMKEHPEYGLVPDMSVNNNAKWCNQNGNMISSKKTSVFPSGTTMFTRYVLDEEFDPTGDGRPIKMGISIGNSIDLSRGFSIMPYHYRGYCTNSMFHVATQQVLADGNTELVGNVSDRTIPSVIAQDNLRNGERFVKEDAKAFNKAMRNVRHTKRLTDELINENIVRILSSLEVLKTRYSEMHEVKMTQFHAQRIADTMPKTSLAKFDFMDVKEKTRENGTTYFEAELTKESTTQWEGFNALTDYLSHGSLGFNSTMNHYREVDRIFAQ